MVRVQTRRVIGAIAPPVLCGIVGGLGLLSNPSARAAEASPVATVSSPQVDDHRQANPSSGLGAIAVVGSSILLLLHRHRANRPSHATPLSADNLAGANLAGADFNHTDLSGADLSAVDLSNANLSGAILSGADLSGANLSGVDLSHARLSGAELASANLNGANLNGADLQYANLSEADLRYTNLSEADLRYANLSGADLNCALLSDANFSEANLSKALLFYINSRNVQNLEPLQLKAQPSPFLCNVALPSYDSHTNVNPNRDCDRIPHLLSTRYRISLEEAQGIVREAQHHRWD